MPTRSQPNEAFLYNSGLPGRSPDDLRVFKDEVDAALIGPSMLTRTGELTLNLNTGAPGAPSQPPYQLRIIAADGDHAQIALQSYGSDGAVSGYAAGNTADAPVALPSGATILNITAKAWDGVEWGNGGVGNANIALIAAETQAPGAHGTYISFGTTPIGSATRFERVRIDPAGNFGIGTTIPTSIISKLDVRGGIMIGNTDYVDTSAGSSLVFSLGATSGDTYSQLQAYAGGRGGVRNFVINPAGGNVSIGTATGTAANPYKLMISGAVAAAGLRPTSGIAFTTPNNANVLGQIGLVQATTEGNHYLLIQSVEDTVAWRNIVLARDGGNVCIGTAATPDLEGITSKFTVATNVLTSRFNGFIYYGNDAGGQALILAKSRSATLDTLTYPASADILGLIGFAGANENSARFNRGADIRATAAQTWSATAQGTDLKFRTTLNGTVSILDRMIIDNAGNVGIGATTISARLHSLSTTEQLRLGYDAANFASFTVSSIGNLTIAPSGGILDLTGNLRVSGLTPGRVPIAGTAGLLGDDADLSFSVDTLTSTKFVGTTSVTTPLLASTGNLTITPGGTLVSIANTARLQSSNYASQTTGWAITGTGDADFRYLYADEMHVKSFIADLEQALAGGQIISKSVAELNSDFTLPAAGGVGTLVIKDLPSAAAMAVFVSGDIVRLRQFSRAAGALTIADAWGVVTAFVNNGDGTQNWTFTRSTGANAGSATGTINSKTLVLDYGTTGNGIHEVNAIDGAYGVNSPYSQIVTWATHPQNGQTIRTRLGNLLGVTGSTEYGLYAGDGGVAATNKFVRISNSNFEVHNIGVQLYESSTLAISLQPTGPYFALGNPMPTTYLNASTAGIWMGNAGSSVYKMRVGTTNGSGVLTAGFTWDGTLLSTIGGGTFSGALSAATGTFSGSLSAATGTFAGSLTAASGTITGKLDMSGASSAISIGNPAPLSAAIGTGLWVDRTGMYWITGTAQVEESATVTGTITGSGNAVVTITAAILPGGTLTVQVPVLVDDTASIVEDKIRIALNADTTFATYFTASSTAFGAIFRVTAKHAAANDATMNVGVDNGTCTGLTATPTSSDITAGSHTTQSSFDTATGDFMAGSGAITIGSTGLSILAATTKTLRNSFKLYNVAGDTLLSSFYAMPSTGQVLLIAEPWSGTTGLVLSAEHSTQDSTSAYIRFQTKGGTSTMVSMQLGSTGLTVGAASGANAMLDVRGSGIFTSTAPSIALTDTTASAKSLTIAVDANLAQFRESAGASGSLLVLDLANNRMGVGAVGPLEKIDLGGALGTIGGNIILGTYSATVSRYLGIGSGTAGSFGAGSGFSGIEFGGSATGPGEGYIAFHTHDAGVRAGESMRLDKFSNLKIAGTAERATTQGTNHLDIFDGTSPVGTLANGCSIYSRSGELYHLDAAGNESIQSPHDKKTGEWIFWSKNTVTGKVLRVDMERLMKAIDANLGGGFIHEYMEKVN